MEWIHHADETGEDICMSNVRNYKRTDQELKEDRGDVAERILRPVQKWSYVIHEDKAKWFGFKRISLYTAQKPFRLHHLSL